MLQSIFAGAGARVAAKVDGDSLAQGIGAVARYSLLSGHDSPVVVVLVADCVDYPVGKQAEKEMGVGASVFLMMDGSPREVGFKLAVGCLYFPYEVGTRRQENP